MDASFSPRFQQNHSVRHHFDDVDPRLGLHIQNRSAIAFHALRIHCARGKKECLHHEVLIDTAIASSTPCQLMLPTAVPCWYHNSTESIPQTLNCTIFCLQSYPVFAHGPVYHAVFRLCNPVSLLCFIPCFFPFIFFLCCSMVSCGVVINASTLEQNLINQQRFHCPACGSVSQISWHAPAWCLDTLCVCSSLFHASHHVALHVIVLALSRLVFWQRWLLNHHQMGLALRFKAPI